MTWNRLTTDVITIQEHVNLLYEWKTHSLLRGGMGLEWFPVLDGPEVGSPTEVPHQLHFRAYCSDVAKWSTRDRRDFCFRSRYFQFRPGGKPRAFWVNIRANSYLGPILPRLRGHTRGFGLARPLRSRYFCFRRLSPGADTTIDLLARVQQNRVFPCGSADFIIMKHVKCATVNLYRVIFCLLKSQNKSQFVFNAS